MSCDSLQIISDCSIEQTVDPLQSDINLQVSEQIVLTQDVDYTPTCQIVSGSVITQAIELQSPSIEMSILSPVSIIQVINIGIKGDSGSAVKAAVIAGASFTGSPKKCAVVFSTPYPNTDYAIVVTGTDSRIYTYESKTALGFTINANASTAISGEVSWMTTATGEN